MQSAVSPVSKIEAMVGAISLPVVELKRIKISGFIFLIKPEIKKGSSVFSKKGFSDFKTYNLSSPNFFKLFLISSVKIKSGCKTITPETVAPSLFFLIPVIKS